MRWPSINARSIAIPPIRAYMTRWPRSSSRTTWARKSKRSISAPSLSFRIIAGSTSSPAGICAKSVRRTWQKLTRDVVKLFSGTELDEYFRDIVSPAQPVGPALYLQLNLYAHQRFPHYLAFARNLLAAYSTTPTVDNAAYEAVLRRHWYDAEDLRMRFFERLSKAGRLDAELSIVRTRESRRIGRQVGRCDEQSPAAVRLLAEGEAWRCHFENAAPMFLALESSFPADRAIGTHRRRLSLAGNHRVKTHRHRRHS